MISKIWDPKVILIQKVKSTVSLWCGEVSRDDSEMLRIWLSHVDWVEVGVMPYLYLTWWISTGGLTSSQRAAETQMKRLRGRNVHFWGMLWRGGGVFSGGGGTSFINPNSSRLSCSALGEGHLLSVAVQVHWLSLLLSHHVSDDLQPVWLNSFHVTTEYLQTIYMTYGINKPAIHTCATLECYHANCMLICCLVLHVVHQ